MCVSSPCSEFICQLRQQSNDQTTTIEHTSARVCCKAHSSPCFLNTCASFELGETQTSEEGHQHSYRHHEGSSRSRDVITHLSCPDRKRHPSRVQTRVDGLREPTCLWVLLVARCSLLVGWKVGTDGWRVVGGVERTGQSTLRFLVSDVDADLNANRWRWDDCARPSKLSGVLYLTEAIAMDQTITIMTQCLLSAK